MLPEMARRIASGDNDWSTPEDSLSGRPSALRESGIIRPTRQGTLAPRGAADVFEPGKGEVDAELLVLVEPSLVVVRTDIRSGRW